MAKTLLEYRQEEAERRAEARARKNALLNYMQTPDNTTAKEEAKASSGGFGDYIAEAMLYGRAGPTGLGLLAGLTKPLWYDKLSDEAQRKLDNYVDSVTFIPRKVQEGALKSVEGITDTVALLGVMNTMPFNKNAREAVKSFTERDFVGEWYNRDAYKHREDGLLKDDGFVAQGAQAVGGMLPSVIGAIATGGTSLAVQGATKLPQIVSLATTAAGAMGNASERAYQDGAGFGGGLAYGAAIGGLEAATEKFVGGGLDKIHGAGFLDDIIPIGNWAKTGVGRYAANAAGEGLEEMVSEAVDPLAKAIYKGKDAFTEYDFGEHMKDIGKAGLMGAAVSGVYGGAFDLIGGGVKAGDVDSLMNEVRAAEAKGESLQNSERLDSATREKLNSQTLGDLRAVEKILKDMSESKRAEIIESRGLADRFEADGSLKNTLDGDNNLEYNNNYVSYTARNSVQKIVNTLSDMSADVAEKYAKANNVDIETAKAQVGEFKLYDKELTEEGSKAFTKFKKGLSYLNKSGGGDVKFAVVEPNSSFNGAIKDGVMYIGADTFENGKWAGTLVHEYMHYAEGTAEYDALVKHLEADDALLDAALSLVSGKAYGFDGSRLDTIIEKANSGAEITVDERRYYGSFKSEVSAHMGELLLGSEAFIDSIVALDGNIAQKTVAKIKSLKGMFERLGNAEASAEYKFLKRAENLYLKAAEKAGDARLIRYITSGEWDEEEAQYARKKQKYLSYKEVGEENVEYIRQQLYRLYSGVSSAIATEIAIEQENTVYIVDSGKENGKINIGIRNYKTIVDLDFRKEVIRKQNEYAISAGCVSDGLFEKLGGDQLRDSGRSVRRESGEELQADQGKPENNQNGVSGKDGYRRGVKYSFKENSVDNETVDSKNETVDVQDEIKQSDNKKPTSYTKAEAEAMVDGIMESLLSFEWGYGELKNRASVIKQAHAMLNGAEAGKRHGEALKFADYLIEHVVLSERVDTDMLAPYADKIEMLKPYLHKLNLDSIRGEINYRYDKGNRPYLRWAKHNGERGIGVDVMAMELEEQGYILSSRNPADMFFEIDDDYREAVEALKKNAQTAVKETFTADELKQLRNDIAKDIMASFDERDFSLPKLKQIAESRSREAERLREENAKLRKEAWRQSKVAERAIAQKNKAEERARKAREAQTHTEQFGTVANRVLGLVRNIKNWKKGVFESAASADGDVFKNIIGELGGIEVKESISPLAARKAMRKLADWYGSADNYPIVQEIKDAEMWDEAALKVMQSIGHQDSIDANKPLSVSELRDLEGVIRHLKHIVETYHRVFRAGKYVEARPLAEDYIKIIGENAKVNVGRVAKLIDCAYYGYFGDVESLMKWHDRYNKDGFLTATFNELREGALNMAMSQMEMRTELEKFLDKNPKLLTRINNETMAVEDIEITRAEAISLYMTAKREHSRGGIAVGGFEVVDKKTGQKHGIDGLVEIETKSPKIPSGSQGEMGTVVDEAFTYDMEKMVGLVGKFQESLYSQFTDAEKRYIEIVENILNNDCKNRKERTDNIRLGYSNTIEDYYYPIRRGHIAQKIGEDTLGAELGRIRKLSFNQDTVPKSKGRLFIEPVNEVVDRHIAGIAMYENMSIAIDNFNRLFNLDVSGNKNHPHTIATALSGEGGWAEAGKYIDKLIKDIEGIKSTDKWESKAIGFIRSGFVKFQLGANPKTWVTQLSSLFAAMSVMDPKYVGMAMAANTHGKVFSAELDEYSTLAKLRNTENTVALAQGVVDKIGRVGETLMKPIGATDRFVVKKLWYACQLQVEAEQKLKRGSDANKIAAAKLLEKVIFETQQNSLLTERSAAMRSSSELIKGITMFSADAMKLTARIVDAYGRICVIKDKMRRVDGEVKKTLEAELKDAVNEFKRASVSATATAIFMSIVALAFSHLYGKKEDDETLGDMAKTFVADFAGNLLGGLPLIRDIYSCMTDGYELNHYALSSINDLISGVNGVIGLTRSWIGGDKITRQEVVSKTKAFLFGLGQLLGVPLRNAYNVGRGVVGLSGLITGNGTSFGYAWDSIFFDKNYSSDLTKAIEKGDDKLAARISALMVGESFDGVDKSVSDELRRLVATGADVLPRAVGDSITYDGEEYAFTLRQRKRFEDIYSTADEVMADMVKLKQYRLADDEAKARAIKFLYETYYQLAVDDMLGVNSMAKNVLFAEAIDIEKLAIIVAQARMLTADKDKNGNSINGSKKLKVVEFIESLSLSAVQKHMILGYLGYKNTAGAAKVTAYVNGLKLTKAEKKELLKYSGYAA